jgi:hypothetical protein
MLNAYANFGTLDEDELCISGGNCYSVTITDGVVNLYQNWQNAEFNIFGYCCGSEANFNSGTSITVVNSLKDQSGNLITPSCVITGYTAETNNLNLGSCTASSGQIAFTESNSAISTVTMIVNYLVVGGGSPPAPVFHYVLGGVTKSLTLPLNKPKSLQADTGSGWSVTPNPLTGSTSKERWDSNQPLLGTATATTIVFVFYHQTRQTLSYKVEGGGTPTAPSFQSTEFGSPASVTLTTTATKTWFDVSAAWTVTNPLGGSTSSERWFTSHTTSGTIGSASIVAFTYRHEYYLTMLVSAPTAGMVSPKSGWNHAGSTVAITATSKTRHKFQSWTGIGSGSYTGTSNPATITMNSAITETANFT